MKKSESSGRIRQVAVMLSSVDATTARLLLGQLPAAQARLVRQQLATLQNVTPAEREAALQMLAQIKRKANPPPASTAPKNSSARRPDASPAEALLSSVPSSIDRVEITDEYRQAAYPSSSSEYASDRRTQMDAPFTPIQPNGHSLFASTDWTPAWQQWSGLELAQLLANERPNLIAAVLLQAPAELGSKILEALPAANATAVLTALPQLHTTDPSILHEIYAQLHQRLSDFQRQSSPDNAGMTKLQAILSTVSHEVKERLAAGLSQTDPLLAHSLGVSSLSQLDKPSVVSLGHERDSANTRDRMSEEKDRSPGEPSVAFRVVVPPDADAKEIFRHSIDTFEELVALSPEDLALIFQSVEPQTVLLAVSGSSRTMQKRLEELVDAKEVKRLRDRLRSLRSISSRDKQSAQEKLLISARALVQRGRIASSASITVFAAA